MNIADLQYKNTSGYAQYEASTMDKSLQKGIKCNIVNIWQPNISNINLVKQVNQRSLNGGKIQNVSMICELCKTVTAMPLDTAKVYSLKVCEHYFYRNALVEDALTYSTNSQRVDFTGICPDPDYDDGGYGVSFRYYMI